MSGKAGPIVGSILWFVAAPGIVAGWVPYLISRWHFEPAFLGRPSVRLAGGLLVAVGLVSLIDCFVRFAIGGQGTPAPLISAKRLVVTGLYRYVRNPMYLAVVSIIVGQGLILGSIALLAYAAIVWLMFHLCVVVVEEPSLSRRFGESYGRYRAQVRRWSPSRNPRLGEGALGQHDAA